MSECGKRIAEPDVRGPYAQYDDVARFEYGRRLWRLPAMRACLLAHRLDEWHPNRERLQTQGKPVEDILGLTEPPAVLDGNLSSMNTSLRPAMRKIPPVFGSFF